MSIIKFEIRATGRIIRWVESKGFGFIEPDNGKDEIFVHISDSKSRLSTETIDKEVTYKVSKDSEGRKCAVDVWLIREWERQKGPQPNIISLSLVGVFLCFVSTAALLNKYPAEVLYVIIALSLLSLYLYAKDKTAARMGFWRTSENTLHLVSILGGWPGATVARILFSHKTSKQPFTAIFWCTVVVHCGFVIWTFTNSGEYFIYTHIMDFKDNVRQIVDLFSF